MVSFLHLLPLAFFFLSYKLYDIYIATFSLMVTSSLVFPIGWYIHKKINRNEVIMLGFILVFGLATLIFHNANFIMWKVSIIFWVLSLFVLGNKIAKNSPTSYILLGDNIQMSPEKWANLDNYLIYYGLVMGTVNWFIFTYLSEATWVNFKTFGLLTASVLFSIIIAIHISRNAKSIS
ncbi:MAG: septation protein IspZ [Pseudomonadota bacterium]|nr:septation protein IspZ [Pseudomonadota bacterium]